MVPSVVSWTDAAALGRALGQPSLREVLVLGGTGDEALALAAAGAAEVRVGDLDEAEHAIAALKLAAVRALPPQSTRALFGLDTPGRRVWFYHFVKDRLDPAARAYWDAREHLVRGGLVDSGDSERHLARARGRLHRWVHAPARARELCACPDLAAQQAFLARRWDTPRWALWLRACFPARTRARARALGGLALAAGEARLQRVLLGTELRVGASWAWSDDERYDALKAALPRIVVEVSGPPCREIAPSVVLAARPLGDDLGARALALQRAAERCAPGGRVAWWSSLDDEPPLPSGLRAVDVSGFRDTSLCGELRVAERA